MRARLHSCSGLSRSVEGRAWGLPLQNISVYVPSAFCGYQEERLPLIIAVAAPAKAALFQWYMRRHEIRRSRITRAYWKRRSSLY